MPSRVLQKIYLENKSGGANKFWECSLLHETDATETSQAFVVTVRFGPIGKNGQIKELSRNAQRMGGERAFNNFVGAKRKRGYYDPKKEQVSYTYVGDYAAIEAKIAQEVANVTAKYSELDAEITAQLRAPSPISYEGCVEFLVDLDGTDFVPEKMVKILCGGRTQPVPPRPMKAWEVRSFMATYPKTEGTAPRRRSTESVPVQNIPQQKKPIVYKDGEGYDFTDFDDCVRYVDSLRDLAVVPPLVVKTICNAIGVEPTTSKLISAKAIRATMARFGFYTSRSEADPEPQQAQKPQKAAPTTVGRRRLILTVNEEGDD